MPATVSVELSEPERVALQSAARRHNGHLADVDQYTRTLLVARGFATPTIDWQSAPCPHTGTTVITPVMAGLHITALGRSVLRAHLALEVA